MVGEKSTDKISHNTLTSCDHLLFMFMFCSFSVYLSVSFIHIAMQLCNKFSYKACYFPALLLVFFYCPLMLLNS